MDHYLLLLLLAFPIVTGQTTCYSCYYTYSGPDNVEEGYKGCSDQHWNITKDDPAYVFDICQACEKEYTYIDAERYAVRRTCKKLIYPVERMQKMNTCSHIDLNMGNYTRCVCDTDHCNEKVTCDDSYNCWDRSCPTCPC